jgi:hypothetical protein
MKKMSELELYHSNFCAGGWMHRDADKCGCRGTGWALSEVDTFHKCSFHEGRHPEDCGDEEEASEEALPVAEALPVEVDDCPF